MTGEDEHRGRAKRHKDLAEVYSKRKLEAVIKLLSFACVRVCYRDINEKACHDNISVA